MNRTVSKGHRRIDRRTFILSAAATTTAALIPSCIGKLRRVSVKDQAAFGTHVEGQTVSALERKLGRSLKIINQFFQFGDNPFSFVNGLGSRVPLVTLEPWNTTWSQIASGSQDSYMNDLVSEAKSYGKPIFLRIGHEMNGNWYPWAISNSNDIATYKAAWQRMAQIVHQAPNAKLVWCPHAATVGALAPNQYYPGGSAVDILGIDGYSWDRGRTSFDSIMRSMYSMVTGLDNSKDVWVCETGCGEGAKKPAWVDAMFASTKFPKLKAVVYFSVNKEQDWRIDSSTASLNAFRANMTNVQV